MGNTFENKISAEDSIKELEYKQSLIKKFFTYSSSKNNFMGYKCCKTKISGIEIKSDFTFYLYNIEGFFDIENGFFFTLQNLIWIMKCFNENSIDTKSYQDFSLKIQTFLIFLQCLKYKVEDWKETAAGDHYTQGVGSQALELGLDDEKKEGKQKNNNKFKKFMDFAGENKELPRITSFIMASLRNCKYVINFLESIIPFEQFKGYVSSVFLLIEGGCEIWNGIKDITKLYKALTNKNYYDVFIYLIDGAVNLYQGSENVNTSIKQISENYNEKKFTKAQRNLNVLLNKMDLLFDKLKENNMKELYKNNIIVLAIDETNRFMKDPDIGLINVEGIENYAKSLDKIDVNRNKFFMNMIIFYQQLKNIISSEEYENKKDFNLRYGFMTYLKKIILTHYKQQSWNSMNEENIIHLINDIYQEYYDNLNESDDYKREIYEQEKIVRITSNRNRNEIMEKKLLTKTPSISSYSFIKKNENNNNDTKYPKIIEEEKKNHKIFYSTSTNGFYKKDHNNTKNITPTTKSILKRESNYCKLETLKNQDKIYTKGTNNFKGCIAKYKRRNEDKIISQDLSLKNSAPPPIGFYYKK